jgi:hypothetical protein
MGHDLFGKPLNTFPDHAESRSRTDRRVWSVVRGMYRRKSPTVHARLRQEPLDQALVHPALALSIQRRVASSLQPGTANRPGGSTCLGGTLRCGRADHRAGGLDRCTGAALAAVQHNAITKPNANVQRIGFLQQVDWTVS